MSDKEKKVQAKEVELEPDGWERFERAVDVVAKSPPQHRGPQQKKAAPKKSIKKKTV